MSELNTLKKAFSILGLFTRNKSEYSISEITQQLHMNRGTVTRILATLVSVNMLSKSPLNRKYRLGGNVIKLAKVFVSHIDLATIALPYMQELQNITKETILLHTIDGNQRLCIAGIEGSYDVRRVFSLGTHHPLHAGAPGKVLLAFLPSNKIEEYITSCGLTKYTENTITTREVLSGALANIRNNGYATSYEEHTKLSYGIAAPIRNYLSEVVASISISGVTMRISPEAEAAYISLVKDAANKISEDIGYENTDTQ